MKILLFIIFVIITIVRAVNKNKNKTANTTKSAPKSPLSEIWGSLMEEKNERQEEISENLFEEEELEGEFSPEPIVLKKNQNRYNFNQKTEGASDIEKIGEAMTTKTIRRKKSKILDDNFSLKKAVIYSEIINKKYI